MDTTEKGILVNMENMCFAKCCCFPCFICSRCGPNAVNLWLKVVLQCRGLLRLIRWGTWCIDRYLWWSCHLVTTEGVNGMDPKTCVDSYDSQRSVHLHRVDKVRWSRRVCTTSQKMLKIFKVNVTILPQPKPPRQYQWSNMNMTELPVARFLLISKK